MKAYIERLWNGLVKENPVLVLMLGMCPALAVTTQAVPEPIRISPALDAPAPNATAYWS